MSSYLINKFYFLYDIGLFLIIYIFRFYLVIRRGDWFMVWLGLEINIIIFIIIVYEKYRIYNIESCIKYFFIQSLGSAVYIRIFYINIKYLDFILCLVLRYKMGGGPFFFWFPSICNGISWVSCFVLISFQKIIPLILIRIFVSWAFIIIIIIGLVVGVFGSFNQKELKKLMAYSSIYHLGWIILCIFVYSECWFNYLIIYIIMIFPVIYYVRKKKLISLVDIIKERNKLIIIIIMLRIAGIPPFLGFFLKWFVFIIIIKISIFYIIILIICSVVIFYVYFRIIYDILIGNFFYEGWNLWFEDIRNIIWLDLICIIGILFGVIVRLYLIF